MKIGSMSYCSICKASSDSHFAFLHFFFMGMVLIPVSWTMSRTSAHSSSGTLHTISVLYRAHVCMKCSVGISDFLEEISVFILILSHELFVCFGDESLIGNFLCKSFFLFWVLCLSLIFRVSFGTQMVLWLMRSHLLICDLFFIFFSFIYFSLF